MSTASSEDLDSFRTRCRDFLREHAVTDPARIDFEANKRFLLASADAGLAGIVYPKEYGGAGLTAAHDRVWREEKAAYPLQDGEFIISHGMCLPMMNEHGTDAQKKEFMADMISGKTLWCQMFSEPGAGSDVASLQSKAERDGDEWVISGQKVWTTLAHKSDYGLVIVRTDPNQPKHAGISMFILDMKDPRVDIRAIHQIDGGSHFNEVFFNDVRVPAGWLIGDLNNGWNLATSMLMYERVAIGSGGAGSISHPRYDLLAEIATANGKIADPVVRDQLMRIYTMESVKSLVAMRTRAELKAGKTPGPGGSLGKLMGSVISWYYRSVAMEIAGASSVAWDATTPGSGTPGSGTPGSGTPGSGTRGSGGGSYLGRLILNSFQDGIAGGTDEIQRNIIGDRVLGLPREPSVDTKLPFRELKVGTQRSAG